VRSAMIAMMLSHISRFRYVPWYKNLQVVLEENKVKVD